MYQPHSPKPPGYPWEVYCDESQDRGDYDFMGSLWLTHANALRMRRIVQEIRERCDYPHEFKWKKASGSQLYGAYRELATKVTDQIRNHRAHFYCIAIRKEWVDYNTYHEGDRELGYYKFFHLLLRKQAREGQSYVVVMDHKTNRKETRIGDLKRTLNRGARRDRGINYDCFRDIAPRPSKEDDLLQVVDVLLGAVGFHYAGGHHNPESSRAKNELAHRIAQGIGKPNLAFASLPWEPDFNIWRWEPGGGRG